MKTDLEYLKSILEVFANSQTSHIDYRKLEEAGFDLNSDRFIHHFLMCRDKKIIVSDDPDIENLGLRFAGQNIPYWSIVPFRLSAYGYEYLKEIKTRPKLPL